MPEHEYSIEVEDEVCAKAMGKELHISPKDSVEICREIKGKRLIEAQEYLEKVMKKESSVPYKRHDKKKAHRSGKGKDSGGYPIKAAKEILGVLQNVENNAEYKGFSPNNMRIIHASAKRGITYPGIQARAFGRASPSETPTTNIEIVVRRD